MNNRRLLFAEYIAALFRLIDRGHIPIFLISLLSADVAQVFTDGISVNTPSPAADSVE